MSVTSSANGIGYILGDRAMPLAAYPHMRESNGLLFVSGVSARRPDNTVRGVERSEGRVVTDIREQTRGVIENIRDILAAAGAGLEHVVTLTAYLVDMDEYGGYNEAYNDYFSAEDGPSRTTVAVAALPGPHLRVEMTAVAHAPRVPVHAASTASAHTAVASLLPSGGGADLSLCEGHRMHIPEIDRIVLAALEEDIGAGDITTLATVPSTATATATFVAKTSGVLAGLVAARRTFELLDPRCTFTELVNDGTRLEPGMAVAEVRGPAQAVLTGERTALNFVQRLSGVATTTARVVAMLAGTRTQLLDTRKTTPGMRALEKAAVRAGGGRNHRIGLFDAVMIKNNHLQFASPAEAIRRARASAPATATIEIEVETFDQLREALTESPDIIMLDNMGVEKMREALGIIAGRARVEVSGNVTPDTIPGLTDLGVDYISMGALTHSSPSLDLSLRVTQD